MDWRTHGAPGAARETAAPHAPEAGRFVHQRLRIQAVQAKRIYHAFSTQFQQVEHRTTLFDKRLDLLGGRLNIGTGRQPEELFKCWIGEVLTHHVSPSAWR